MSGAPLAAMVEWFGACPVCGYALTGKWVAEVGDTTEALCIPCGMWAVPILEPME